MGAGQEVGHQVPADEVHQGGHALLRHTAHQLAPHHLGPVLFKPPDDAGVKGLHAVQALIALQQLHRLFAQLLLAGIALQLDDEGRAAVHQLQHFCEPGYPLLRAQQPVAGKLLIGHLVDVLVHPAGAGDGAVMVDHHLAVPGQLQVELHAKAAPHRQVEGHEGVLRHTLVLVVEAPVGVVKPVKGREIRPGQRGGNGPQPEQHPRRHNPQRNPYSHHLFIPPCLCSGRLGVGTPWAYSPCSA